MPIIFGKNAGEIFRLGVSASATKVMDPIALQSNASGLEQANEMEQEIFNETVLRVVEAASGGTFPQNEGPRATLIHILPFGNVELHVVP